MKAKLTMDLDVIELEGTAEDIFKIISMHKAKSDECESSRVHVTTKKTVKKKKRKKKKGGKIKPWTDKENETLKKEYYAKKTFREIAAILGRTEKAISLRVVKLKNDGYLV